MADISPDKKSGCAAMIYGGLFRHRFWVKRSSTNTSTTNGSHIGHRSPSMMGSKRRRGSDETAFLEEADISANSPPNLLTDKPIVISTSNQPKNPTAKYPNGVNTVTAKVTPVQAGSGYGRRVPKEAIGLSGELDSMINDHQQSKGSNNLVRASSGNVMLFGNLGNLRQPGTGTGTGTRFMSNTPSTATNVLDHLPKTAREMGSSPNGRSGNGNVVTGTHEPQEQAGSLCRALSTRMDPEQLKAMGNEDYKNGRFAEALALYDRAIGLDPDKACYRSNKSAALTGLGRLLEAVFECREAIRIEPTYHRAHFRLASLCLRLGEAEKSLYHYKQAGPEASSCEISQAKAVQTHLNKCTEAKRLRDWNALLKETGLTISSGADSAPQIFGLQVEALLKLHKHEEANATLSKSPKFDTDQCTKFFGPIGYASILVTRAQVDMAIGRFEDAVTMAQLAVRLDSSNKDVNTVLKRAKGVATARSNGNELFKASKFLDACIAYGEGLEHDSLNSVLLCNRAACRSKLGQFEKAIEDCTKALNLRPSYSKARLRRADCNAKLERWEASVQDYEILKKEMPNDDEVSRALLEAQAHIKKQHSGESKNTKVVESGVVLVTSNDHFRKFISSTSQGISVVLFFNKSSNNQPVVALMDQLCRKYPSFNFLKVEVEDHPQLSKFEGVNTLPVVKMYRNGSRIKEIQGTSLELIESTVKFYSTS